MPRLAPRIVIVMPDQWRRALLRAALREAGYDAVGTRGLRQALLVPQSARERGPVRIILLDQDALGDADLPRLEALRERHDHPDVVFLARAMVRPPEGPWHRVLRRPISVADLVSAAESVLPLPPELRHAIDVTEVKGATEARAQLKRRRD
jgi:DNA-binding NtrC family response regulator